MNDEELSIEAKKFIRKNKQLLIQKFANEEIYKVDIYPVTVFMAGAPGVGKTEISKRLIETFQTKPIRIDADEIREICPGYNGANSHIFQSASTTGVHILYDYVLARKLNVILDATFAYGNADKVETYLDKMYTVDELRNLL